jgi:hypothetical protein
VANRTEMIRLCHTFADACRRARAGRQRGIKLSTLRSSVMALRSPRRRYGEVTTGVRGRTVRNTDLLGRCTGSPMKRERNQWARACHVQPGTTMYSRARDACETVSAVRGTQRL